MQISVFFFSKPACKINDFERITFDVTLIPVSFWVLEALENPVTGSGSGRQWHGRECRWGHDQLPHFCRVMNETSHRDARHTEADICIETVKSLYLLCVSIILAKWNTPWLRSIVEVEMIRGQIYTDQRCTVHEELQPWNVSERTEVNGMCTKRIAEIKLWVQACER